MDLDTKRFVESLLIFRHRPEVSRVVFISTPHRGSAIASNWIGHIGIALVKLPPNLTKTGDVVIRFETNAGASVDKPNRLHFPTSIDTLSPNNRFVLALNTLPIADHVPYHSIIGDRGRGDTPNSSDGVVDYWSSHLEGAQSERIVPSDHSAHHNKEGMEEVHRILLLNLTRAIAKGPVSGAYESEGLRSRQTARSSVFANFSRFCDIPRNWTAIAGPLAHALSGFQSGFDRHLAFVSRVRTTVTSAWNSENRSGIYLAGCMGTE
jgi:hypothetical protein